HVPELQAQATGAASDTTIADPASDTTSGTSTDTTSAVTSTSDTSPPTVTTPAGEVLPEEVADLSEYAIEAQRSSMEESLSRIARYDIEIHKKFALSVACFVFV